MAQTSDDDADAWVRPCSVCAGDMYFVGSDWSCTKCHLDPNPESHVEINRCFPFCEGTIQPCTTCRSGWNKMRRFVPDCNCWVKGGVCACVQYTCTVCHNHRMSWDSTKTLCDACCFYRLWSNMVHYTTETTIPQSQLNKV